MIAVRFLSGDLGKTSLEVWKDEVLDQSIEVNNLVYKLPLILRYSVLPQQQVKSFYLYIQICLLLITRQTVFKWVFDWLMPSMGKIAVESLWSTADYWKGLEDSAIRKQELLKV